MGSDGYFSYSEIEDPLVELKYVLVEDKEVTDKKRERYRQQRFPLIVVISLILFVISIVTDKPGYLFLAIVTFFILRAIFYPEPEGKDYPRYVFTKNALYRLVSSYLPERYKKIPYDEIIDIYYKKRKKEIRDDENRVVKLWYVYDLTILLEDETIKVEDLSESYYDDLRRITGLYREYKRRQPKAVKEIRIKHEVIAPEGVGQKACPYCGASFVRTMAVCPHCGALLAREIRKCPNCGASVKPGDKFCSSCGNSLADSIKSSGR